MFRELGISKDDQTLISNEGLLMEMGLTHRDAQGRLAPAYDLPLTKKMYETLSANKNSSAASLWSRKYSPVKCTR